MSNAVEAANITVEGEGRVWRSTVRAMDGWDFAVLSRK
jgi:hypothetical protein